MSPLQKFLYVLRRIRSFFRTVYRKTKVWLRRFRPGRRARKGAITGAVLSVLLFTGYSSVLILRTGWGTPSDIVLGVVIGAVMVCLAAGIMIVALSLASRLPKGLTGWLVGSVAVFLLLIPFGVSALALSAGVVLLAALFGGSIAVLTSRGFRLMQASKRVAVGVVVLGSASASVGLIAWAVNTGTDEDLVRVEMPPPFVSPLSTPDPSKPGVHAVRTLTYGSGEDRRDEYGRDAQLKTKPVDAKAFVEKPEGWLSSLRRNYWGFDHRKFPLNGRVWYPGGRGPYPLVLVVHGNHLMREYSDPGYAYLGELLASRGYIVVSVDQNFLNSDWSANYRKENDARAWLLLEHLRQWRKWQREEGTPFFGLVDLDRISLIGHSRGGEAVAVAAAFNRLRHYPDDARVTFDYGFGIRSIVAIAPIDGQYMPAGRSTPVENINYFVLQGSHDADLYFFSGDRQYRRIEFTDGRYYFKAALYIYRANHGQFNTVWGSYDWGLPHGLFLNRKPYISGEEQRQIARVTISAFLDVTLKDDKALLPLFRDHRFGRDWLPETFYVSRFEDARTRFICVYDEDVDVTSTSVKGGRISGEGLATWREQDLGFRGTDWKRQNQVVVLGWDYGEEDTAETNGDDVRSETHGARYDSRAESSPAVYAVALPHSLGAEWKLSPQSLLTFSAAEIDEKPAKPDTLDASDGDAARSRESKAKKRSEEKTEAVEEERPREPLDFSIEVVDVKGESASLSLTEVMPLLPPLKARFTRFSPWESRFGSASEPVLQTMEIPLSRFRALNGRLNSREISQIRFRFDRTRKGVIALDEVGFRWE